MIKRTELQLYLHGTLLRFQTQVFPTSLSAQIRVYHYAYSLRSSFPITVPARLDEMFSASQTAG
jgi:hypothetical protein